MVEDITRRKLEELVPDPLTGREAEVLRFVAEGWTNRRIAEKLAYSEAMVKVHVRRVLVKLGVRGRDEAAHRAVEIGLISPPRTKTRPPFRKNAQNG